MTLNIKVGIGNDFKTAIIKLNKLPKEISQSIENQLFIEGLNLRQDMITSMKNTPGGGRTYSSGRIKPHIASKPYHPPAIDNANLAGAFVIDQNLRGVEVGVGVNINLKKGKKRGSIASYAEDLEFGTSKMAPRSFMRPALDRLTPGLESRLKASILGRVK